MILLAVMPCMDAADLCSIMEHSSSSNQQETNALSVYNQDQEHNHEHEDFCSPFCVCSCCGISIINYAISTTIVYKYLFSKSIPAIRQISSFNHLKKNWKPPQQIS